MAETITGSGARTPFEIAFACDLPPEQGGPEPHKHTGTTYWVTPPKQAFSLTMARRARDAGQTDWTGLAEVMDKWMDRAFGKDTAAGLRDRLDDDDDLLDLPDLNKAMEVVATKVTGNPPT